MGKHLLSSKQSAAEFHNNNNDDDSHSPGCMWGILQILHYHHWHNNFKKVLPHKKHYLGRHARYKRKTIMYNHGISTEDTQFGDGEVELEAESLLVRKHSQNVSATSKSSTRSQKRGIDTANKSKERNSKGGFLSLHAGLQHLESSIKSVQYDDMHNVKETHKLNGNISNKFKDHADVKEVFRVEKDLILKFLRDIDVGSKSLQLASNEKVRLTKSGSFPLPASSPMRSTSPSTNQIWACPKGEKLLAGTQAPKMFASISAKDLSYMKPVPLESNTKQNKGFSPSRPPNHKGWNQFVLHRFKIIKQKIKLALMEFAKNGAHQASVEAIHHRASSQLRLPRSGKKASQNLEDGVTEMYTEKRSLNETRASDYDSSKHEVHPMRRTSSLNESLDRYIQLFEQSFSKDIKWHSSKSKSLKLMNEAKIHTSGAAPKLSKRNLSLPNLEALGFDLHEAFCDTNDTGLPGRTSVDGKMNAETDFVVSRKSVSLAVNEDKQLQPIMETEIQEVVQSSSRDVQVKHEEAITSDLREDIQEQVVGDQSFRQEEETGLKIYPDKDVISVRETKCEDNATSHAEGAETASRESSMDELEVDVSNVGSTYSLPGSLCNTDDSAIVKGADKSSDRILLLLESDRENDSDFQYVKSLVELSGFMGNEHIQSWHTVDEPLKPSLFKDLEASLLQETTCSGQENSYPNDHQLLFDLVNEVLLEIYERSSTYFPGPFSFNGSFHSMPKGHHLLNEVWTRVNSYLNLKPELDQTLDDVVGRDLTKTSGWMNLQWDEEFVALELEEMFVEDLLNEIICS